MKRKLFFFLPLWIAGTGLHAQLTLTQPFALTNTSCGYFDPVSINIGPAANVNPLSSFFIVGTNPSSGYDFKSVNKIQLSANANSAIHIGAASGSTGKFHAQLLNNGLVTSFITPANPAATPLYSKVELGLNLSSVVMTGLSIDNRIHRFLTGSYKPGSSSYNTNYQNKVIINPYDPDHISIDAVFFKPSSPNANPVIRHGFFYKDFTRVGNTDWDTAAITWVNNYEWRIRMAPDELGDWNGFINVWVDGQLLSQTEVFTFHVVSSSNPGNVLVDNVHSHYLKFSNGTTYFPIGDNYCWTSESYGNTGALNYDASTAYTNDHRIKPTAHDEMEIYLDKLTGAPGGGGGNTTRIFLAPWGFQVEREKLNNYDTRQIEMWELDGIFDMMEQRGVYCVLSLNLHVELGWDDATYDNNNTNYSEHWNFHPYADPSLVADPSPTDVDAFASLKGIPGVSAPEQFFTDPACKDFFKKRLRYIVSRWGYSTSLGMYELLTEIDGIQASTSYWTDPSLAQDIVDWHDEMYDYVRNVLNDQHIRTGTFTGDQFHESDNGAGLWALSHVDLVSDHSYPVTEDAIRWESAQVGLVRQQTFGSKPTFRNEHDVNGCMMLVKGSDWPTHNKQWSSAFTGDCGPGLSWVWYRYYRYEEYDPDNPNHDPWNYSSFGTGEFKGEYEKNFPALRTFTSMIDFRNYDYTPSLSVIDPSDTYDPNDPENPGYTFLPFETYYLQRTDNVKVYGWTHNRSFNQFTFGDFMNPYSESSYPYDDVMDIVNSPAGNPANCINSFCNSSSYWNFTSPQYGTFNRGNYNSLFSSSYDPMPLGSGDFYINNLLANTEYKIEWFWTWGPSGGQSTGLMDFIYTDNNGLLHVNTIPPTGSVISGDYPGDWAFEITALPPRRGRVTDTETAPLNISANPNPSNGIFVLQSDLKSENALISVYSVDGRLVKTAQTAMLNGYKLDMSGEPEGVYFANITRGTQSEVIKIVLTAHE